MEVIEKFNYYSNQINDKNNYRLKLLTDLNGVAKFHVEYRYSITSMGEAWVSIYATLPENEINLQQFIRALNRSDKFL